MRLAAFASSLGAGDDVIALTGWGQEDDKVRSYEAGCDTHIIKPIDVTKLEEVLAELRPRRSDPETSVESGLNLALRANPFGKAFRVFAASLESSSQYQNQQNQKDQTQRTARRISPSATVRPGRHSTDQHQ